MFGLVMARHGGHGGARFGTAGRGGGWQGQVRRVKAVEDRRGLVWPGRAWRSWLGAARPGEAGFGQASRGGQGGHGWARHGWAWHGWARHGLARRLVKARLGVAVEAGPGMVGPCLVR